MAKKKSSELDKECQICGGAIWGKGIKVVIEGAKITVCQSCAQYGTKVQDTSRYSTPKHKYPPKPSNLPKSKGIKTEEFENLELKEDFAKIINNRRNNLGLNQEQFAQKLNEKPSLLKRIETGKVDPTFQLARKIEKVYDIKILKQIDSVEASFSDSKYLKKTSSASLGDIAFIKRKKK